MSVLNEARHVQSKRDDPQMSQRRADETKTGDLRFRRRSLWLWAGFSARSADASWLLVCFAFVQVGVFLLIGGAIVAAPLDR